MVWPPEGMTEEEAREEVVNLYNGLSEIPVEERAEAVASRVSGDQFAQAVETVIELCFLFSILAVPVVFGTVLGHILLQRGNWLWVCLVRYLLAWWSLFVSSLFLLSLSIEVWSGGNAGPKLNGKRFSEQPHVVAIVVLVSLTVAFLAIRRWKRKATPAVEAI